MPRGKFNFLTIKKLSPEDVEHYNKLFDTAPHYFLFAGDGDKVYATHSHEFFALKTAHGYRVKSFSRLASDKMGWDCSEACASTLRGVREVVEILCKDYDAKKAASYF